MNILRKMAAFFVQRLEPAKAEGWPQPFGPSDSGESVSETSALALSTVWACRNLIAGTISSLPIMVYRTTGGQREEARDHPLWRVLHDSPNYDQTAVDCWDYMTSSIELWGNGYARVVRERGEVKAIVPTHPDGKTVRRLSSGTIEYRWTEDGKAQVHTDRDMLHIRGPGGDPLGGMSTLAYGRQAIGAAKAADRAAASIFRNGLRPSGTMTFKEWLTKEQRDLAEGKMADKYIGAVNSGRPMLLEGGVEWKPVTINPDDAQMLESRAFSVEEICRFFGVPPFMVGHTEKSTSWGTGIEQQTIAFQRFTLRARLKRIEQALAKQLMTPEDRAQGLAIEFNIEGLLRGDSAGRSAFYTAALGTTQQPGWMTVNEIRRLENLPPKPGGDEMTPLIAGPSAQEAIAP